jgi:DNA-directed RNA polymerase specialized sigma24 family protein
LKQFWANGQIRRFWAVVNEDLLPALIGRFEHQFHNSPLSREDIEDCCQEALEVFVEGDARHVSDPESYIWKSVRNACLSTIRKHKKRREVQKELETEFTSATGIRPGKIRGPAPTEDDDPEIVVDEASATLLVEELVGDVDPREGWVPTAVGMAVSRLRPALRQVVVYWMEHNPDPSDKEAAAALRMREKSYRANKSKAFAALRTTLPKVIEELGVDLSRGARETIFEERYDVPSPDE